MNKQENLFEAKPFADDKSNIQHHSGLEQDDDGSDWVGPLFSLSIYDDAESDLALGVDMDNEQINPNAPAPLGLLYGLAILMLDRTGQIEEMVEQILATESPTGDEVMRRIELLVADTANVQAC